MPRESPRRASVPGVPRESPGSAPEVAGRVPEGALREPRESPRREPQDRAQVWRTKKAPDPAKSLKSVLVSELNV